MTYIVTGGALNSTHSLTLNNCAMCLVQFYVICIDMQSKLHSKIKNLVVNCFNLHMLLIICYVPVIGEYC